MAFNWEYERKQLIKEIKRQIDWRRMLFKGLRSLKVPKVIAQWIAGVDEWTAHQVLQRELETREGWLHLMRCYNWTCVKTGIQNMYNKEPGKPKLQRDHVKSIGYFGRSEWMNYQPLVDYANKSKGMREIDYRTEEQKKMQYEYGKKHHLI